MSKTLYHGHSQLASFIYWEQGCDITKDSSARVRPKRMYDMAPVKFFDMRPVYIAIPLLLQPPDPFHAHSHIPQATQEHTAIAQNVLE